MTRELIDNWCDGSEPHSGESVRVLPIGGSGNVILCHSCFCREIDWRIERNKDLADFCKFDLPNWTALEIYHQLEY